MLIDDYMPVFDVRERHHVQVRAPRDEVYAQVRKLDMSDAKLTQFLFRLRGLSAPRCFTLDDLLKTGFCILDERAGEELLLGLVGQFWTPRGNIRRITSQTFRDFDRSGYAKATWNFYLSPSKSDAVKLATETRVRCTDNLSRWQFRVYWMFIGSFSGLIRREMLRTLKRNAETQSSIGAPMQRRAI